MPLAARPRPSRLLALAALTVALTPVLLAGPAAAEDPAAPAEVAAGDVVVGELVQAWADPEHPGPAAAPAPEHTDEGLLSWIDVPDGESVRVPTEDVADLDVGATVEVTVGGEVRDEAAVEQGLAPAREVVDAQVVAPAETAATTAPHTNGVTVVMVQPGGQPRDGTTLADVVAAVDGPVRQFWHEQSNGAITVAVTAQHDWISTTADCRTPSALWQEVAGHPTVGWAGDPGEHLLVYVPYATPYCSYGLGTIGSGVGDGGLVYVQDTTTSVIAHELGHNFGLGHSSAVQCDASPESAPCRTTEYWDFYDVMGISWDQVGSLNAPHAERLGLLPSSAQRTVSASVQGGTFVLAPMGGRSGTRVLALTAGSTRYWVEYRAAVGRDSWLSDPWTNYGLQPGVLVHVDGPGPTSDTSLLLDSTPAAQADWDADEQTVLPEGSSIALGAGFSLSVTSASASGATVDVRTAAGGPAPETPIGALHRQLGGASGRLGSPTTAERCGLRDGGCLQEFQGGSIYWSPATGARVVDGDIRARWGQLGWENGYYGYPVADARCGLRDGGCLQLFQGGSIYWTPALGAVAVDGAIRARWGQLGWENGYYGYPVANARCGLRDGGCLQLFQGGSVYWTAATGAVAIDGAIRARWGQLGWENGRYGYAVANARCGLRDGGCLQQFQGGSVYWTAATGAVAIDGDIRTRWGQLGWENGHYGYPQANARCGLVGLGCVQQFQGGSVYWTPATGAVAIDGDIRTRWGQLGWENGHYGYPQANARCGLVGLGCVQQFQGGSVYWTPATGAVAIDGDIRTRWGQLGWENGYYGYPQAGARCGLRDGGCLQQFLRGSVYWSPATGAQAIDGAIRRHWGQRGYENGPLGYPVAGAVRLPNGDASQRFQGGTLLWSAATGQVRAY
ncbi:LGFP repeat-containing protein [Geodermatophilus dictyosporus]|uniref:LGFP repeat-containing protein n=1 Tax=Geodermatophilus dictyosporus TaxID=1523247 RepID=A0A1I5LD60_9ACTN|nr:M66 family metalloprotease [Geodermatophilus dictyosporus]SFO94796.1 LGFP repeat-containing protein [Geodermatophilus dictyosporus]